MKKVITTETKPIKMWVDEVEEGALNQIKNLANLPFIFKHVAIMPDCHKGYGMPIGSVIATEKVVIPNAVGVDIGCGMTAVQTSLTEISRETLLSINKKLKERIPVGFKHHKEKQKDWLENDEKYDYGKKYIVDKEYENSLFQLGTLGGGNHFIEIQKGSDGFIWIMLHSGSRNLGFKVANHYNKLAIKLNEKWFSSIPKEYQLAFLPNDSEEGKDYLSEMELCQKFAFKNRDHMMQNIKNIFQEEIKDIRFNQYINIHHNFAAYENHFGRNILVHRKGATKAYEDQFGIIPGSQGSFSYIVKGKGNPDSFKSCSHGAGRRMGRKEAKKNLDFEKEKSLLDSKNIIHDLNESEKLDEAPSAYKDINYVMECQKDLVEIIVELSPLMVIKG
jgi:tRNA-splicing ligase RtcB